MKGFEREFPFRLAPGPAGPVVHIIVGIVFFFAGTHVIMIAFRGIMFNGFSLNKTSAELAIQMIGGGAFVLFGTYVVFQRIWEIVSKKAGIEVHFDGFFIERGPFYCPLFIRWDDIDRFELKTDADHNYVVAILNNRLRGEERKRTLGKHGFVGLPYAGMPDEDLIALLEGLRLRYGSGDTSDTSQG